MNSNKKKAAKGRKGRRTGRRILECTSLEFSKKILVMASQMQSTASHCHKGGIAYATLLRTLSSAIAKMCKKLNFRTSLFYCHK